MKTQPYIYPALLIATLLLPAAASAQQTTTADLQVSLKIQAACKIEPATLDFGTQAGLVANVDVSTDIVVNCTNGAEYQIGFGLGQSSAGNQRHMKNAGGDNIKYQLYKTSAYTDELGMDWGVDTIHEVGTGADQEVKIYGRVPAQVASVGDYTDTVVMTLQY